MNILVGSDWHGCMWIWEKTKKILKEDDVLFFLGDAADRGPDGWELFKQLIDDPRVIYIKGNHDDFMYQNLGSINPKNYDPEAFYWDGHVDLWYYNGGEPTYNAFLKDKLPIEKKLEYVKKIAEMPLYIEFTNTYNNKILLSHSGDGDFENLEATDEEHWLWDRSHWMFADAWYGKDDEYIIHGHTPIELMIEKQKEYAEWYEGTEKEVKMPMYNGHGAYFYGKGHKICIDTGAVWNNTSVLLNLDTWEETILECTKKE